VVFVPAAKVPVGLRLDDQLQRADKPGGADGDAFVVIDRAQRYGAVMMEKYGTSGGLGRIPVKRILAAGMAFQRQVSLCAQLQFFTGQHADLAADKFSHGYLSAIPKSRASPTSLSTKRSSARMASPRRRAGPGLVLAFIKRL
jgi:hypothetical protein